MSTENQTPLGVSVYCLRNTLLKEVYDAGLYETSSIHEIEDLREKKKFGVIRQKGAAVRCPRDNRIGAAYVDCLEGSDNVGPANRMLSYAWAYTIGDVISSLETYCELSNLDTKTTYVWICCLCNNQHRVNEEDVPFEKFHQIFHDTVIGVGHILAMMTPWDKPLYLTRVWCVFEVYTADAADDVGVDIIMPPREKDKLLDSIEDYNNLVEVLSATDIKLAKASRNVDRVNIMRLVNNTAGGASKLNKNVNALLRGCFERMMLAAVDDYGELESLKYASLCHNVGRVMKENNNFEKALELYQKALAVKEKVHGEEHTSNAATYNNIASVMHDKGDLDGALEMYRKCLAVQQKVYGENHRDTAVYYVNIGLVMKQKGDLDVALEMYQKALAVQEKVYGVDHTETTVSYNNIGSVMKQKGDLDGALEMHQKALAVREKLHGTHHPSTAISYYNIGGTMESKGDIDGALEMFHKALAAKEKVLGVNHSSTIQTKRRIARLQNK